MHKNKQTKNTENILNFTGEYLEQHGSTVQHLAYSDQGLASREQAREQLPGRGRGVEMVEVKDCQQ